MGIFRKSKQNKMTNAEQTEKTLHKNLDFTATEQYKLLRTNLTFTLPQDQKCSVVGVTSSIRDEGKSTTAINVSYVLAESGKRVLLIDGDLRIPSIAKKMEIRTKKGLTDFLMGNKTDMEEFKTNLLDSWYIMPSGSLPPNPSELLGSKRMAALLEEFKADFDYVIIDLPPVNLVSDALAVSKSLTGIIVVVREDYTEKRELENCLRQLQLSDVHVLGCVMNRAKSDGRAYGKYKRRKYYKYRYYQASEQKNNQTSESSSDQNNA